MENTPDKRHNPYDHAAAERMAAAGQNAVIAQGFGKGHADAGAYRRRDTGDECEMRFMRSERHGENRRQRGHAAIHQPG